MRGLRTLSINEAGVVLYRPGSIGITSHLDGKRHRRLVIVLTLYGTAEFALCRDPQRDGRPELGEPEPGSITLLRGPGLAGGRDGRPFHRVGTPKAGRPRLGRSVSGWPCLPGRAAALLPGRPTEGNVLVSANVM